MKSTRKAHPNRFLESVERYVEHFVFLSKEPRCQVPCAWEGWKNNCSLLVKTRKHLLCNPAISFGVVSMGEKRFGKCPACSLVQNAWRVKPVAVRPPKAHDVKQSGEEMDKRHSKKFTWF